MHQPAEHIDSYYAATAGDIPARAALDGDRRCDVCVVGGGLTGLSAALELAERGLDVVLLEANRLGWGASGRSGGQIIFGYSCDQSKIAGLIGQDHSQMLWDASLEGVALVRERITRYGIDCDFADGHVHVALKPRQARELREWQADMENTYGYGTLEWWDEAQTHEEIASPRYVAGLYDRNSGHLHPLRYTLGVARAAEAAGAVLHEASPALRLERGAQPAVVTPHGKVTADHVILGTNAYLAGVVGEIESRLMPVGSYIGASEPLGEATCRELIRRNTAIADMNFVLDYYRCSGDWRVLFGGRVSYSTREPRDLKRAMRARMVHVFPQLADARMDFAWGGFVGITVNRAPHFGTLDGNIIFAQGFSGHGMAVSGLAGRVLAEAVRGQAGRFDVFSQIPHLPFPGGRRLRTPALVLAMSWYRLRDLMP